MADISKDALRKEIAAVLKDADLATTSAKKVRQQIEEKLEVDLSERRKEVDELVMECLEKKQEKKEGGKKRAKSDDDEESEEQEESEEESEQEEPKKRSAAKKPPPKRAKKASSDDESEEASDDNASDEEYSPAGKKGKAPKKSKAKGKKKGSDSDDGSDEDWNKSRRSTGGGGGGGAAKKAAGGAKKGGGGGGYTRAYNLSPELAAVMGTEKMARHEVVRKMWSIIKEKNLYDPKNKQYAICNDELLAVFGVKRFRTFGMMKYLKNHFID